MLAPALPDNESARLEALHALGLLDTRKQERFARYTRIAKTLIEVPISTISLIDADRQQFHGACGLDVSETSRQVSFCGHAILECGVFYIPDTLEDERFADNPLVTGDPHIRFYAGCPIYAPGNYAVGTLCVIDRRPRRLDSEQLLRLRDLADCLQRELGLQMLLRDIERFKDSAALASLLRDG